MSIHNSAAESKIGMSPKETWQAALGELQMQMPRSNYETWLKDAYLVAYEENTFVIGVPNSYVRDWLDYRLRNHVLRTLGTIAGHTVDVRFTVAQRDMPEFDFELSALLDTDGGQQGMNSPAEPASYAGNIPAVTGDLDPRYTFETFIVGSHNRMAQAVAQAVANDPGRTYNPLFLWGGVGLGKTHLLQAVGHSARRRDKRVLYVSSETFTNDMINAIQRATTESFRAKYRTADLLLIDDIQFIAGKESTQEEFFHTFNALHGAHKQIVITSDRPPKAISTLEERLRSRFEWGIKVDIQPPDLETRIAIVRSKAEAQAEDVAEEVLTLIAQRVQSNVRELEGTLNSLVAHARLMGRRLTLELAEQVLGEMEPTVTPPEPDAVIHCVAEYYGFARDELLSRRRGRDVSLPRQLVMYLLREDASLSLPQIGTLLERDHSTVMHGHAHVKELLDTDDVLRRQILDVREALAAYAEKEKPLRKKRSTR